MQVVEIMIDWTPFALARLDEIYDYVVFREKSEEPAIKLVDTILKELNN